MIATILGKFRAAQYFFLSGILVSTSINLLTSVVVGGIEISRLASLNLASAFFLFSSVAMSAIGGIVEEASERVAARTHTPLSRSEKLALISTEMRSRQISAYFWTILLVLSLVASVYALNRAASQSTDATKASPKANIAVP